MANELKTYGDLKKLIQGISRQQKGEKILSKIKAALTKMEIK